MSETVKFALIIAGAAIICMLLWLTTSARYAVTPVDRGFVILSDRLLGQHWFCRPGGTDPHYLLRCYPDKYEGPPPPPDNSAKGLFDDIPMKK